jgi:hypothetical protein
VPHYGAVGDVVDPLVIGHGICPTHSEGHTVLHHTRQLVWCFGWERCQQLLALLLVRRIDENEGGHVCRIPLLVVPDRKPSE